MCRIAGYFGPPIAAVRLLHGATHGLEDQSRNAREMKGSSVAGDGWGIGWFTPGDRRPGLLKSLLPLWSDLNAQTTSHALVSGTRGAYPLRQPGDRGLPDEYPPVSAGGVPLDGQRRAQPLAGAALEGDPRPPPPGRRGRHPGIDRQQMLGALWSTCRRDHADGDMGEALAMPCASLATWPPRTEGRSRSNARNRPRLGSGRLSLRGGGGAEFSVRASRARVAGRGRR